MHVNAETFNNKLEITGVVLTKLDEMQVEQLFQLEQLQKTY